MSWPVAERCMVSGIDHACIFVNILHSFSYTDAYLAILPYNRVDVPIL